MQIAKGQGGCAGASPLGVQRPDSNLLQCDRIQPCTACSLHQIAGMCQYDLTETERQPILQAEALKKKDKAIASLRNELQLLQGQPRIKMEPRDDDSSMERPHRMPVASITSNRPAHARAQHYQAGAPNDSIYFGTPGTTSVVEQVRLLSHPLSICIDSKASSLPTYP